LHPYLANRIDYNSRAKHSPDNDPEKYVSSYKSST